MPNDWVRRNTRHETRGLHPNWEYDSTIETSLHDDDDDDNDDED
jgi:hypothetical protein